MTHNTYYIMIFFRRNRHACGQITKGSGNNYGQNFSTSCVSQTSSGGKDNSETVMQAVDAYTLTKPSKSACPNRYMSAVAYPKSAAAAPPAPTMPPVMAPTSGYPYKNAKVEEEKLNLRRETTETKAIQAESAAYPHISRVVFEVAEVQGEQYVRKIESMRMIDQAAVFNSPVCSVEQVFHTSNIRTTNFRYF
jgi:hypothetical protein